MLENLTWFEDTRLPVSTTPSIGEEAGKGQVNEEWYAGLSCFLLTNTT